MYTIGIDLGSSSVKVALIHTHSGKRVDLVSQPDTEMEIIALKKDWAEQNPKIWWKHICSAIQLLIQRNKISSKSITGIGIAYQMHGLVIVNVAGEPIRNAIIWCDSRAVEIGEKAFTTLGKEKCCSNALNSPGNFTASKMRWVQENEPENYAQIHKLMLPGDYIAYKLSNRICTTISGLSEGIFWDFKANTIAQWLLDYYGIATEFIPEIVPTFSIQGTVTREASIVTGLAEGTPILYRAGDQPNNALSLDVFEPGEIAATGGTSGVIYAITEKHSEKDGTRINNFAHVNHTTALSRIGKLLCINGCGIQYRWLLNNLNIASYEEMNILAQEVPIGSDGVTLLPFGNGAERMLDNKNIGAHMLYLNLNRHDKRHLCRAALEGIAFAFVYGITMMTKEDTLKTIRAGNDNLFRSAIFSKTLSSLIGQEIALYNVTGAIGAARACQFNEVGFAENKEQHKADDYVMSFYPDTETLHYKKAYGRWEKALQQHIK